MLTDGQVEALLWIVGLPLLSAFVFALLKPSRPDNSDLPGMANAREMEDIRRHGMWRDPAWREKYEDAPLPGEPGSVDPFSGGY
jgi:hypothetical protein